MHSNTTFYAWALDTRSDEGHGFLGRYWWASNLPVHLEGCEIALFKTRAIARQHLPDVTKYSFPKAQVVRVRVTVETLH